jgi:hypothetical protein
VDEGPIRRRLAEVLSISEYSSDEAAYQVVQGALSLLGAVYGPDSLQVKELVDVAKRRSAGYPPGSIGEAAKGALRNLQGDLEAGLVGSLRARLTGAVISDFVELARLQLAEGTEQAKNVAAVLAAAVYEDTIRRMGAELAGVTGRPKLADVLGELKSCGVLQDAQFGIAQAYLQFRNDALHADWGKVERESVASILGFVENLLLKHFS